MKLVTKMGCAAALAAALVAQPALAGEPKRVDVAGKGAAAQVVEIAVTGKGFEPAAVKVKAGRPVKLVVTRKTERTCATEIVVKEYGVNQPLPLDKAVEVTFTPTRPGTVRYACGMDMIAGVLTVE
jgi:plastocyanin domain-containing protein